MVGLWDDCFLKVLDKNVDVLVSHRTRQTTTLQVAFGVVPDVGIYLAFNAVQRTGDNTVVFTVLFPHPLH
jgi:hypothetical protein